MIWIGVNMKLYPCGKYMGTKIRGLERVAGFRLGPDGGGSHFCLATNFPGSAFFTTSLGPVASTVARFAASGL